MAWPWITGCLSKVDRLVRRQAGPWERTIFCHRHVTKSAQKWEWLWKHHEHYIYPWCFIVHVIVQKWLFYLLQDGYFELYENGVVANMFVWLTIYI